MGIRIHPITPLDLLQEIDNVQKSLDRMKLQIQQMDPINNTTSQIERITDLVETQYGLSKGAVYKLTRKREIVEARQMSILLMYYVVRMKKNRISLLFKLNNKGSVPYSIKTIKTLFGTNPSTLDKFIRVCEDMTLNKYLISQMIAKQ